MATQKQLRMLGFNSILVQLEDNGRGINISCRSSFQFHIGAIRRNYNGSSTDCAWAKFQFHIGAIRSYALACGIDPGPGFNSILVQLEANSSSSCCC